jgi:Type II restriction endonuclease EcoO109I
MGRGHHGLPRAESLSLSKTRLLKDLLTLDKNKKATKRILSMETTFRERIGLHVKSLPTEEAKFCKFNTNPFVLMFHCLKQGYKHISQIEHDILPAKIFSSMETSAGRMVETVTLPIYSWESAPSEMHSSESVIDGKKISGDTLCLATLKSGPRCLNDEMSSNIADDIINHCEAWASTAKVSKIDFTYGVLYGTKKISNKKDWHILRNLDEKVPKRRKGKITVKPAYQWNCAFVLGNVEVTVNVRIGIELWNYIAGQQFAFIELATALIRACVTPSDTQPSDYTFAIADLRDIISLDAVPKVYNVSILQRSQLEWLFFFARHFCDELVDCDATDPYVF